MLDGLVKPVQPVEQTLGGGGERASAPAMPKMAATAATVPSPSMRPTTETESAEEALGLDAAAAVAAAAATTDPTWSRLFLDQGELAAFSRGDDRRDIPPNPNDRAFAMHRGLCAGTCEWIGNEAAAVYRIVETRWLFASTKAAKTYLDSLKVSGAESDGLPTIPPLPVGDGAYAWGGVVPSRSPATRRQIVCFRIGRVVAKIAATEGPRAAAVFQVLASSMLQPYADLVVRRVRWALAQYWLAVMRGTEAANKFVETPPRVAERDHVKLFADYPILVHPEFPTAMASLGELYKIAAERLVALRQGMKSNNWSAYRETMRLLVRAILDEQAGEARLNADAALNLVLDHRRIDSDFSWSAIEAECRERTERSE
jgi:hypothetical protein